MFYFYQKITFNTNIKSDHQANPGKVTFSRKGTNIMYNNK